MTTTITNQPAPVPADRTPAWDLARATLEHLYRGKTTQKYPALVLADMAERDRRGREKYGMPLTADNGRDHLIDAYQNKLDLIVYLAAELDERGVNLTDEMRIHSLTTTETAIILSFYEGAVVRLVQLRELIGKRGPKTPGKDDL